VNPKLLAAPAVLAALACSAGAAQADSVVLGTQKTNVNQGINSSQAADQQTAPSSGTTIINNSDYAPSISQGAANVNLSTAAAKKPGIITGTDTFKLTGGSTKVNQGIDNSQNAAQGALSGTTLIINASAFRPSLSQGVGNLNFTTKSGNQAINTAQRGSQSGIPTDGTLIINRTPQTAVLNQGAGNVNCNGASITTCSGTALLFVGAL